MAPLPSPFALSLSKGCDCRCVGDAAAALIVVYRYAVVTPAAQIAAAPQQMEGFRPLHDGQEGRFRTASLHPPSAPKLTTFNIWLMFCRATGSPQCALHGP